LSGTIPLSLQGRPFAQLDLSFNKFTGNYDHRNEFSGDQASLILEVNRLSGRFPSPRNNASGELKALRSNLFGCENVPDSDEYSEEFDCGSENLELSLLSFVVTLSVCVMFVGVMLAVTRRGLISATFATDLAHLLNHRQVYISYLESVVASTDSTLFAKVKRMSSFSQELGSVSRIFRALLCVSLVTCFPIYVLKFVEYGTNANQYTTHSFQYRWVMSIAYLKGNLPAGLVMFMWMSIVCMMVLFLTKGSPLIGYVTPTGGASRMHQLRTVQESNSVGAPHSLVRSWFTYVGVFLVNAFVTGSVNGAYIYFSTQALSPGIQTGIQMVVAVFKVVWNMVVIPLLAKPMQVAGKVVNIELILSVFNNILIPCVVTFFTSPACFQVILCFG
jgi:hypothetical protein